MHVLCDARHTRASTCVAMWKGHGVLYTLEFELLNGGDSLHVAATYLWPP